MKLYLKNINFTKNIINKIIKEQKTNKNNKISKFEIIKNKRDPLFPPLL